MRRLIKNPRKFSIFALLGAFSFWLPDVLIHALSGYQFDTKQVWMVSGICPLTLLLAYALVLKKADREGFTHHGIAMMAGVWLLGGIFMMTGYTFSGGGFAHFDFQIFLVTLASFFPVLTCMMATYDGSLLALIAVTFGAILILAFRLRNSTGREKASQPAV